MLNNLISNLEDQNIKSIYTMDEIWDNQHGLVRKYSTFLSPDSITYSSRLNPIFSFEIEKYLSAFKILSLRDGVYPLLRFFFLNPQPVSQSHIIIIDEKLSSLVPDEWRPNVFLRSLFVEEKFFPFESEECLLLISPDKDNLPLDILKIELENKAQIINSSEKISLFFSTCIKIGEVYASEDTSWRYIVIQRILELFPSKKIEILDWNGLLRKKMNGIKILEINPLHFYFTDSFLIHELYQKGAVPAELNSRSRMNSYKEHISIYHGFTIYPLPAESKSYYETLALKKIFTDPISVDFIPPNYKDLKLTTKSFQDFCSDIARKIFHLRL